MMGQYYECADKAFNQINILLNGGKISEPMRYISNALISVFVAFLFNFIIVALNTKIFKATNSEMLKNCFIKFSVKNIVGKKTGTKSVYSPVADSSYSGGSSGGFSGGGSSGGFSGGGSSGGGGGHRF